MSTEKKTTDAKGRTTEKKEIKLVVSPYFKVRKTLVVELHRLLVEFGLTPAARARIMYRRDDKREEDPLEAILKARAGMN